MQSWHGCVPQSRSVLKYKECISSEIMTVLHHWCQGAKCAKCYYTVLSHSSGFHVRINWKFP